MDFGSLLLAAQKNENKQAPSRFYQTKFSAPKKESKQQKNLSENIKKFMAKKEEEDRKKALEEKKKKEVRQKIYIQFFCKLIHFIKT